MYEYKIVRIPLSFWQRHPSQDPQAVIDEYANQGWRLFQFAAPPTYSQGTANEFMLIFEREKAS